MFNQKDEDRAVSVDFTCVSNISMETDCVPRIYTDKDDRELNEKDCTVAYLKLSISKLFITDYRYSMHVTIPQYAEEDILDPNVMVLYMWTRPETLIDAYDLFDKLEPNKLINSTYHFAGRNIEFEKKVCRDMHDRFGVVARPIHTFQ